MKAKQLFILLTASLIAFSANAAVQLSQFRVTYEYGLIYTVNFDDTLYEDGLVTFNSVNDAGILSIGDGEELNLDSPWKRISWGLSFSIDDGVVSVVDFYDNWQWGSDKYSFYRYNLNKLRIRVRTAPALVYVEYAAVDNAIDAEVQAVPVPAAAWLFGSALVAMAAIKRR